MKDSEKEKLLFIDLKGNSFSEPHFSSDNFKERFFMCITQKFPFPLISIQTTSISTKNKRLGWSGNDQTWFKKVVKKLSNEQFRLVLLTPLF